MKCFLPLEERTLPSGKKVGLQKERQRFLLPVSVVPVLAVHRQQLQSALAGIGMGKPKLDRLAYVRW